MGVAWALLLLADWSPLDEPTRVTSTTVLGHLVEIRAVAGFGVTTTHAQPLDPSAPLEPPKTTWSPLLRGVAVWGLTDRLS